MDPILLYRWDVKQDICDVTLNINFEVMRNFYQSEVINVNFKNLIVGELVYNRLKCRTALVTDKRTVTEWRFKASCLSSVYAVVVVVFFHSSVYKAALPVSLWCSVAFFGGADDEDTSPIQFARSCSSPLLLLAPRLVAVHSVPLLSLTAPLSGPGSPQYLGGLGQHVPREGKLAG